MAIAEDASTPAVSHITTHTSGNSTSNSFSPPAGSLVVVPVTWMFASGKSSLISCNDSLGNSYTSSASQLDNIGNTSTDVFYFYYSSAPGSITVGVHCTSTSLASTELGPRVLTGAASVQTGAAHTSANSSGQVSITTTKTGSWVYIAGGNATTGTPSVNSNTTSIDFFSDSGSGDIGAIARMTNPTGSPGAITIGWTSHIDECTALEILPGVPPPVDYGITILQAVKRAAYW